MKNFYYRITERDYSWKAACAMILANNKKWFLNNLFGCGKVNIEPLVRRNFRHPIFITALLLVWAVTDMDPHLTDWVTKPGKFTGSLNCQPTNLNVTRQPAEPFVILSSVCDKVTEGWWDVFQKLSKEEGTFWNYVDLSMLFSPYLDWNLLPFLPTISHFDVEHYSWKKITKVFKILKWTITPTKADFSDYFSSSYTFQFSAYMLSLNSEKYNSFHET